MKSSRIENSLKNVSSGIVVYMVNIIFQFVNRLLFLKFLDVEYLGINGLFSNVLSMLNIAELGIAGAMVYALYKPLKDNNTEEIKSILLLYKKLYRAVGSFVLIAGIITTQFLHIFINTSDVSNISHLKLYFILYVLDSGVSYFLSYKRSIILCNQQSYIISITNLIRIVLTNVLQIALIAITHNYFIYLLVKVICTLGENVLISHIADKKFPFIKENSVMLDRELSQKIRKNIFAMSMHKIGTVVVFGTDNIIISKVVSLAATGLYSNYTLITNAAASLLTQIFTGITASVGNLLVDERDDKEKFVFQTFKNIFFMNFCIYYVVSVGIFVCMQNFIAIWIGEQFLLTQNVLLCIVISFFSLGIRKTVLVFKDAGGLFWNDRYKPLLEALSNLIFSIPLAIKFGIVGTIIGTIITNILVAGLIEGYVTYKYLFKKKVFSYLLLEGKYYIITIFSLLITGYISNMCSTYSVLTFIIRFITSIVFAGFIIIIIFHKTNEFKYLEQIMIGILNQLKTKIKSKE